MPIVRIDLWKGRTKDQKKKLIKEVANAVVSSIGCPPEAIHTVITEVDKENWGIGGEQCSEKHPDK